MWVPDSSTAVLVLLLIAALGLGLWANTQKMLRNQRFEYYYFDFNVIQVIVLIGLCLFLGQVRPNEITFLDTLPGIALRKVAWALVAGALFNLANILLAAGTSVGGLSLSFPAGFGISLFVTSIWGYFQTPSNAALAFGGAVLGLGASVLAILAYQKRFPFDPKPEPPKQASGHRRQASLGSKPAAWKGILVSVLGGLFLAPVVPLIQLSHESLIGLPSYGYIVFFAVGIAISSVFLIPGFLFFPLQGDPGRLKDYRKVPRSAHMLGWAGGAIWAVAGFSWLTAIGAAPEVYTGKGLQMVLGMAAPLLAGLCGLFLWSEYKSAKGNASTLASASLLLLAVAIGMVSFAPN